MTLGLATLSGGVGAAAWVSRVRARRRRWVQAVRALEGAEGRELGAPVDHLPQGLGRLVLQARLVRVQLGTPLRRFALELVHDTPWSRRTRCDEYDRALADARMAIWDWLRSVERLPRTERALLAEVGWSPRPLRHTLFAPGVLERTADPFEDVLYPELPDLDHVAQALAWAGQDLLHLERALLAWRPSPYR